MSRIGKQPIPIPDGVTVDQVEGEVRVKGPKGTLSEKIPSAISVVSNVGSAGGGGASAGGGASSAPHPTTRSAEATAIHGFIGPPFGLV